MWPRRESCQGDGLAHLRTTRRWRMELFHRGWRQARLVPSHDRATLGIGSNAPNPSINQEMGRRCSKRLRGSATTSNIQAEAQGFAGASSILNHSLSHELRLAL